MPIKCTENNKQQFVVQTEIKYTQLKINVFAAQQLFIIKRKTIYNYIIFPASQITILNISKMIKNPEPCLTTYRHR